MTMIGAVLRRLYDPALRLTTPARRLRAVMLDQARVRDGDVILDVGAGTGSLLIMLAERGCRARLIGVDRDRGMLQLAQRKANRSTPAISWAEGSACDLPFRSDRFDRILTTWMLHHLTTAEKRLAFGEMFRVLRPGGELHFADWGPPHTRLMRVAALSLKVFEPQYGTLANLQGQLPGLCAAAGFRDVRQTGRLSTIFGTVIRLSARRL